MKMSIKFLKSHMLSIKIATTDLIRKSVMNIGQALRDEKNLSLLTSSTVSLNLVSNAPSVTMFPLASIHSMF